MAVFGEINKAKIDKNQQSKSDKSHAFGLVKLYLCCSTIFCALKKFKPGILSIFFMWFALLSTAQQKRFSGWGMTVNTIGLSPRFNLIFDSQLRSSDQWKQPETFILRPGLTYVVDKRVSISAGLALIQNWRKISSIRDGISDNRLWQQLGINSNGKNSTLQHRLRLEERWIPTLKVEGNQIVKFDPKFNARFRYFTRHISFFSSKEKMTKGMYWVAQNEFFFNAAGANRANGKLFDQSRTYAGIGYRLSKQADLEIGYMYLYTEGKNKEYTINQVVQLSSFLRL